MSNAASHEAWLGFHKYENFSFDLGDINKVPPFYKCPRVSKPRAAQLAESDEEGRDRVWEEGGVERREQLKAKGIVREGGGDFTLMNTRRLYQKPQRQEDKEKPRLSVRGHKAARY